MTGPSPNPKSGGLIRSHHDVFISYAQLDKTTADAICAKLESRRIRCWIAPRDVQPSKDFPAAIIEGIEGTEIMVLVFSSHANNSPHVIRELTNAVNKGRIIIPFRVEDVVPSKSMEYLIGVPHWLDAITPPLEKHIEHLADTVEHILETNRKEVPCRVCGTPLSPYAKFCKACGAQMPGNEPVAPATAETPAPQALAEDTPPPPPPGKAARAAPPQPLEVKSVPEPSPLREPTKAATAGGRNIMLIAGFVAAIIVLAVLFFILSGPAGVLSNDSQKTNGMTATPRTTVDYRSESAPVNLVTLTVQPTQELPDDLPIYVEVSKDPTNAMITVIYNGGDGGKVVQDNTVTLTRSDGTVETAKLNFKERLSEVEFQGTRGTDRIQVVVVMGGGTRYAIVDKLMPFRTRNI
ncbi:MAG: TIR domain protein [Methanoregula sp. PtaU1.Bin051]|nr:MAG: TIR domain protein [Methanoregula sp. PtaU1.Bin051]